jgi:mannose-1-phosphate guanylyltransferase
MARELRMEHRDESPPPRFWAVVLAGGRGTRLAPLVRRIHPDGRPKQYAVLMGSRSLLRRTLDRAALAVPPERTVVVATEPHAAFLAEELARGEGPTALVQPVDRGTAAGILLPVHWISWRDPDATVAVLPSDHFIDDDDAFMRHVRELAAAAARHPSRILLAGARPDGPETGYGWIEPGGGLAGGLRRVRRFVEKPDAATARVCMEHGYLWNTFVVVAKASAILEAGRRALPDLHAGLGAARAFCGTSGERRAIEQAYASAPAASFSECVLQALPSLLAVSTLPELSWSDWGTPDRVLRTLRGHRIAAPWLPPQARTTGVSLPEP